MTVDYDQMRCVMISKLNDQDNFELNTDIR